MGLRKKGSGPFGLGLTILGRREFRLGVSVCRLTEGGFRASDKKVLGLEV